MLFLSLPNASPDEADVMILPVPLERTVTYKPGTADAPRAILAASEQLEFYEEDAGWCPAKHMRISVLPPLLPSAEESEETYHRRLFETVSAVRQEPLFLALGGEHSITPDMVFARMPEGGTVVQIDAHADLRSAYHGSIYNHACPMRRIRDKGYKLVQIGVRSMHAREAAAAANDNGITTYLDRLLQQPETQQQLHRHLSSLIGPVWLSIDMDGFDPALIAGVGTPQPGGLSWYQGVDIVDILMRNENIDLRGVDIVELVPETSCVSEMVGAKLLQKCISYWGIARGYDQRPRQGSQTGIADE
ncbi:MAG: agmatinase [Gammaproteobacteria bacterium]|nr:agmatinase [Gammaproteobacteria bacterium]